MYCFVIFQKGLRSVFDESSQTAWFFCTTSNIYRYIPTNSHKTLTNYIPVFSGRITICWWKPHENPFSSFRVYRRQTDRQTRRRTLFYYIYIPNISTIYYSADTWIRTRYLRVTHCSIKTNCRKENYWLFFSHFCYKPVCEFLFVNLLSGVRLDQPSIGYPK